MSQPRSRIHRAGTTTTTFDGTVKIECPASTSSWTLSATPRTRRAAPQIFSAGARRDCTSTRGTSSSISKICPTSRTGHCRGSHPPARSHLASRRRRAQDDAMAWRCCDLSSPRGGPGPAATDRLLCCKRRHRLKPSTTLAGAHPNQPVVPRSERGARRGAAPRFPLLLRMPAPLAERLEGPPLARRLQPRHR